MLDKWVAGSELLVCGILRSRIHGHDRPRLRRSLLVHVITIRLLVLQGHWRVLVVLLKLLLMLLLLKLGYT